jgi:Super-infection exclusion protein B
MKFDINIKEILTLPTNIMIALIMASGIILFSPEVFLNKIFMFDFREKYGFSIGLIFVLAVSVTLINLFYNITNSISTSKKKKKLFEKMKNKLTELTDYQKAIVFGLFQEDDHTHELPLYNFHVKELERYKIIGKAASQYYISNPNNPLFPYLLQPWVINELNTNQALQEDYQACFTQQSH